MPAKANALSTRLAFIDTLDLQGAKRLQTRSDRTERRQFDHRNGLIYRLMAEQVARAGKSTGKHLSQDISIALRERRWAEAATLLAELSRTSANNVKLGSLQRWTRDADACVDDDKAQWRALLWLLCRVAAGEAADAPTGDVPLRRSVFAALPRAPEAADPTPACETTAKPASPPARARRPQNARRRTNMI